jgi:uncharacterized damage-inducible protein DinB
VTRLRSLSAVSLLLLAFAPRALAAEPAAAPAATGFRADLVKLIAATEKQTLALEQAIPQAKFGWRPAEGVRSVAELFLHSAGGIYFFLGQMGREPPADVKALTTSGKWESQTTDREAIKGVLTKAFAFLRENVAQTSDADLDKTVQFFGNPWTQRMLLMAAYGHSQEHLGQAIGYARMNGVVPPWSMKKKE